MEQVAEDMAEDTAGHTVDRMVQSDTELAAELEDTC